MCVHITTNVCACVCVHDLDDDLVMIMTVTVWVSHLCPHIEEGGWIAEGEAGGDTRSMLHMGNNFISK